MLLFSNDVFIRPRQVVTTSLIPWGPTFCSPDRSACQAAAACSSASPAGCLLVSAETGCTTSCRAGKRKEETDIALWPCQQAAHLLPTTSCASLLIPIAQAAHLPSEVSSYQEGFRLSFFCCFLALTNSSQLQVTTTTWH